MAELDLRTNPDAQANASAPSIRRLAANGTTLYAEVRGSGPAVLLIHAGGEDAEEWRPIAERLTGFSEIIAGSLVACFAVRLLLSPI